MFSQPMTRASRTLVRIVATILMDKTATHAIAPKVTKEIIAREVNFQSANFYIHKCLSHEVHII